VGFLSGQKEQTVNLPAYAFEGSNPSPTILSEGWIFLEGSGPPDASFSFFLSCPQSAISPSCSQS
jgi:hypothetical protein